MSNGSSTLQYLRHLEVQDDNLVLRRFMPFKRFCQIIETSTLYFPPAQKFEDELEGHPTNQDHRERKSRLRAWDLREGEVAKANQANQMAVDWNRQAVVISCWTKNTTYHSRMWVDRGNEAVAIETTVGRMRRCIGNNFLVIPVRYIDFDQEKIPHGHSLLPFFYKRAELFDWENEVRIIGEMVIGNAIGSARNVRVDLGALIQKITVSPAAPDHFTDAVRTSTQGTIPDVPIERS